MSNKKIEPVKKEVYPSELKVDIGEAKPRKMWDKEKKLSFWDKRRLKKHPEFAYFIVMFYPNGTTMEWVIDARNTMFTYAGRAYVIATEEAYYDIIQHQNKLYYYYNETMPIKRVVKSYVEETKDGKSEAFFRVKSDNAKQVIQQEYVKVLTATNIDKLLLINLVFSGFNCFVSMVLSVVIFLLSRNIGKLVPLLVKP